MNDLTQMLLGSVSRHVLTAGAGYLVTAGLLAPADQGKFVQIGVGIALGGVGLAWSWWQKDGHAKVIAQLKQMKGAK